MMQLAAVLGLRPLDRVQLNNRYAIDAMQAAPQLGYAFDELPYLYFQHVTREGRLSLRSPTGYEWGVAPADVCDVIPGSPLVVRAMTRAGFAAFLRRRPAERGLPVDPAWYTEAYLLHVDKGRSGRIERTCVWFMDEVLNSDRAYYLPVHADDLPAVQARARPSEMPVLGEGGAYLSADKGRAPARRLATATVSTFLQLALRDRAGAARLASAGLTNPSRAVVERLCKAAVAGAQLLGAPPP